MDIQEIEKQFEQRFGYKGGVCFAAPGRINLIGEHTDYNGGFVFPGAVQQCIMACVCPNKTRKVRVYSLDLDGFFEFTIDNPEGPKTTHWRYLFGVVREMMARGVEITGFDAVYAGNARTGGAPGAAGLPERRV